KTVADIFENSASLAGQTVRVKGKVVKYNANIMGRNWIHLQDGTGEKGSNDLTVTSDQPAAVGDVVVAEGVVAIDQDLGSGYFYKVILEKATIEKQ
ncbi:MAG: nucleotide-binding protein, partial [Calditrichaeota bacterium]|nr:nucleotide-binding protein [Calditrichota bacterium]